MDTMDIGRITMAGHTMGIITVITATAIMPGTDIIIGNLEVLHARPRHRCLGLFCCGWTSGASLV